jgi:hypothetical protein
VSGSVTKHNITTQKFLVPSQHTTAHPYRKCLLGTQQTTSHPYRKCLVASQHTSHPYSNYVFSFPTKYTGTTEYLYWLLNVCYMFPRSMCHPFITPQSNLLVLKFATMVKLQSMKYIYVGLFRKIYTYQKYWLLSITNWKYSLMI